MCKVGDYIPLFIPYTMKLSTQTIDLLEDKKERMRKDIQLYKFICVHESTREFTVFKWFLRQLVSAWAFENIGNHYKLIDKDILYHFKKRSAI